MSHSAEAEPFVAGSLTDIASAPRLFGQFPEYQHVIDWITSFVLVPDPRIRRPGAVCPRLGATIDRNLVRLVAVATTQPSLNEAIENASALAELYFEVFGERELFRRGALLACFPHLDPSRAGEFIDGCHARVRRDFVRRGLMLGEFHAASSVGSVHNPAFAVMQCPVPMFAVRALTAHDILFLDRPGEHRAELLRYYLEHVGDHAPRDVLIGVHRALAAMGDTE